MSSVLQLIYQLSVCAFVLQSLQSTFKCLESYLHSISNSRPFSYSLKKHLLYLYAAAKPKDVCPFILESLRIIRKGAGLQFFLAHGLDLEKGERSTQKDEEFTLQSGSAERPVVDRQWRGKHGASAGAV